MTPLVTLLDPRPRRRASPYTFYLPSDAALAHLAPGDLVKLIFEPTAPDAECGAARMWVELTQRDQDRLTGRLDNKPFDLPDLELGDRSDFARHHVIDIGWKDPTAAPEDPDLTEQWLARCLVDRAVVEGRAPVGFLFREPPETPEGSPYPDTGWCLRPHEKDIGAEEYDAEDILYIAIGALLNDDASFVHLLEAPPGSAFARQDDGQFVAVPFDPEEAEHG